MATSSFLRSGRPLLLTLALVGGSLLPALAQVGIGTTAPNARAALEIVASDKGVLVPRLTASQRAAIAAPVPAGLLVYQTDGAEPGFWYYAASGGWTFLNPTGADNLGNHTATTTLGLNGNWLSNAPGNANGIRIDNIGNVGVGTDAPGAGLHVRTPEKLSVSATTGVFVSGGASGNPNIELRGTNGAAYLDFVNDLTSDYQARVLSMGNGLGFYTGGGSTPSLLISPTGALTLSSLAGGGDRMVTTDNDGNLTGAALPTGADNLGNHTATTTVRLNNNWLSNDGGTEGLRVDDAGHVGIGTDAPAAPLHVERAVGGGVATVALLRNPAGGPGTGAALDFQTYDPGTDPSGARLQAVDDGSFGAHLTLLTKPPGANANPLVPRLHIASGGNVGIGTTTPGQKLDVVGNAAISGNTTVGGNVGIGTTSPLSRLSIQQVTAISDETDQNLGELSFVGFQRPRPSASIQALSKNYDDTGHLLFKTSPGGSGAEERVRITADGNVGIGTTIPTQKLQVAGQIYSSTGGIRFPDNTVQTTAATSGNAILNQTAPQSANFNISGNGKVGGQLTAGGATVTGSATVDGQLTAATATVTGNASVSGRITAGAATVTGSATVGGDINVTGSSIVEGNSILVGTSQVGGTALFSGMVAIGGVLPSGGYDLTVRNDLSAAGLRLSRGAAQGRVLTSNSNGTASWVAPSLSVSNGQLTIGGGNSVPFGDNLGNHEATQNLNLDGHLLTGGNATGLSVDATGRVGIGTTTQTNTLEVRSSANPSILIADANDQRGALYLGNTGHGLKRGYVSQNDVGLYTTAGNIYLSATGGGSRDQFALLNNGNVGIGTEAPAAPLHVKGSSSVPLQSSTASFFNAGNGISAINNASGNKTVSAYFEEGEVWVDSYIVAGNLTTTSDRRIKHIVGLSEGTADLALLNRLRITDYTYIDQINNTPGVVKKIIAQEVEEVLPTAVTRSTKPIPNVYERATRVSFADGLMTVTMAKPHELPATGGRLRLYTATNNVLNPTVTVVDAHTVRFASTDAHAAGLFVYGKYVDDFRSVDYDALTTLNVSATQELARKVAALEAQNAALEAQNAALKAATIADKAQTSATLESLADRLRALEAGGTGTGQARK